MILCETQYDLVMTIVLDYLEDNDLEEEPGMVAWCYEHYHDYLDMANDDSGVEINVKEMLKAYHKEKIK
jgi:hypothetical protein